MSASISPSAIRTPEPPPPPRRDPSIRMIAEASATRFGLRYSELISARRQKRVVAARFVAMYVARKHTLASLPQIGLHLGGRDHTTVLHACQRMDDLIEAGDNDFVQAVNEVSLAVGCGQLLIERGGRAVFTDMDGYAIARRVLDEDAVRVSVDDVRAMASLVITQTLPLVEHDEPERLVVPLPAVPAPVLSHAPFSAPQTQRPLSYALLAAALETVAAYSAHEHALWTYGEKSAAARLKAAIKALETATVKETTNA